jgi:hypothetical protein
VVLVVVLPVKVNREVILEQQDQQINRHNQGLMEL